MLQKTEIIRILHKTPNATTQNYGPYNTKTTLNYRQNLHPHATHINYVRMQVAHKANTLM